MKQFVNTSERALPIYADSTLTTKVGKLYQGSVCKCVLVQDTLVALLYRVSANVYKIGFTDYANGLQEYSS